MTDQAKATARIREAYGSTEGVAIDDLDGLTFTADTWWFNVRPSNTEPLLRLNAEAFDVNTMAEIRDGVLALMREEG